MTILHLIHKILLWLPLALVSLLVKITSPILGLFLAWLIRPDGNLPNWLTYFQPDDTLAYGDLMFQVREGAWTNKYPPYLGAVLLCYQWSFVRNAGWGFDSKVAGIDSDITIKYSWGKDIDWGYDANEKAVYTLGTKLIITTKGHWGTRTALIIPFTTRGLLISLGWNLQGSVVNSRIRNLKVDIAIKNTTRNGYTK